MTEAGKKWLIEIDKKNDRFVTPLAVYESILRAFCAEVEKRAATENKRLAGRQNYNDLTADAFQDFKRELLGD